MYVMMCRHVLFYVDLKFRRSSKFTLRKLSKFTTSCCHQMSHFHHNFDGDSGCSSSGNPTRSLTKLVTAKQASAQDKLVSRTRNNLAESIRTQNDAAAEESSQVILSSL